MKGAKLFFLFLFPINWCVAQNDPSFRQFYLNPFHFNPAYTAIDGYADIHLVTRKQWIDFKDAPLISQFSIQYPTRGRVALGFTVFDQEVVALQNTFISTAFAYRVPVSENRSLIFALSGGVGVSNLDLGNYDYGNDPAIINASNTSVYGNAGFGALYEWKRLRIGFSLPQLFGQQYISPRRLGNKNFAQLQKQNYSFGYKFITHDFSIEPWLLFRLSNDNQNTFDIGTTISFRQAVWVGSSVSPQQGTAFFFGMNVNDVVKIGYSYELPPPGFVQTKSMELQLRLRVSQKRTPWGEDNLPSSKRMTGKELPATEKKEQEKQDAPRPALTGKDSSQIKPERKDSLNQKTINEVQAGKSTLPDSATEVSGVYYVVAWSFKNPNHAENVANNFKDKGYQDVGVFFYRKEGSYYVYLYYSTDLSLVKKRFQEYWDRKINCYIWKAD